MRKLNVDQRVLAHGRTNRVIPHLRVARVDIDDQYCHEDRHQFAEGDGLFGTSLLQR